VARSGLRIIGGRLRGRRLPVPDRAGLRPTPDRVRETLFNWLQPVISGSRCLDLFAGSGALGLEAYSRGASEVVLVERSNGLAKRLRTIASDWQLDEVRIAHADALEWLERPPEAFDIVFLDPPYALDLLEPSCARLARGGWLGARAHVYLEAGSHADLPPLPAGWDLIRQRQAGEVCYALAETSRADASLLS